jgi:hypothetical protein
LNEVATTSAAARRQGTSDADEFQLPLAGLFADVELGRGSVHLPDEFQHSGSLAKLQILRDWQSALLRYRHEAMRQFAHELSSGRPEMGAGERSALLRSTCASLHIELPADFAAVSTRP